MPDSKQTVARVCPHCSEVAKLVMEGEYGVSESKDRDDTVRVGVHHSLLVCPLCSNVSVERTDWIKSVGGQDDLTLTQTLFPATATAPLGLPFDLVRVFNASVKLRDVDAESYLIKVRKLLEAVCAVHGASGKNLESKINDLAASRKIPEALAKVAHNLRLFGNHGAHYSTEEVPRAAVPVVEKLCEALLGYLFTMPLLVSDAEKHLEALNRSTNSETPEAQVEDSGLGGGPV